MRISIDRWSRHLHPTHAVLLGFAGTILTGTLLLLLPISRTGPGGADFMPALFTATSAVCVTGHAIVDTSTYWSTFGQVVIMLLIQLGGFGIMTIASVAFILARRRLGLRGRMLAQQETSVVRLSELRRLLLGLAAYTFLFELAVAVVLTLRLWLAHDYSLEQATWRGVFHAVSAFNNAGFALWSDNLMRFVGDWFMVMPIAIAIIVGGIGYPVWHDLRRHRHHLYRLTLHSKLTLVTTLALLAFGAVMTFALEVDNDKTLAPLSVPAKILAAFFQSVTSRTAGFNTISIGDMHDESLLVTDLLMFVGGGTASTAGGIKVGTFAVMFLILLGEAKGGRQAEAFGRTIPSAALRQCLSVAFLAGNVVVLGTLVLLATTPFNLSQCLFEVISAFGTVGLSTGITPHLGDLGQSVLIALMYVGRVGPLTLALALASRERERLYSYPEERPLIG